MATWERQPQENEGTYFFSGTFYVTKGVNEELHPQEIAEIYQNVQAFVKEKNGIDYLQVFSNGKGRKLFFIDQLNTEMIESGQYQKEDNHCTLLWADEY